MEFREREGMTFEEAERRYAELKRRYDAGEIDEEEFDAERQRLVVRDDEGKWWAKSWETGQWHYHNGSAWIEATPPVYHRVGSGGSPGQTVQRPATPSGSLTELWIGVGISVAFVVLVLIVVIANAPQTGSGSETSPVPDKTTESKSANLSVPNLEGDTLGQAAKTADDDFTIEVRSVDTRNEKKGTIYDQDPDPKAKSSKGSEIGVKVSAGKGKTRVPSVKGSSKSEAAGKIMDAGLDPDFDVAIGSDGKPKSSSTKVGKQSTPAGKEVSPGSFVKVE